MLTPLPFVVTIIHYQHRFTPAHLPHRAPNIAPESRNVEAIEAEKDSGELLSCPTHSST